MALPISVIFLALLAIQTGREMINERAVVPASEDFLPGKYFKPHYPN